MDLAARTELDSDEVAGLGDNGAGDGSRGGVGFGDDDGGGYEFGGGDSREQRI